MVSIYGELHVTIVIGLRTRLGNDKRDFFGDFRRSDGLISHEVASKSWGLILHVAVSCFEFGQAADSFVVEDTRQ